VDLGPSLGPLSWSPRPAAIDFHIGPPAQDAGGLCVARTPASPATPPDLAL